MSIENNAAVEIAKNDTALEAWVKPEIVSFDAVTATQKANNPLDGTNNLS